MPTGPTTTSFADRQARVPAGEAEHSVLRLPCTVSSFDSSSRSWSATVTQDFLDSRRQPAPRDIEEASTGTVWW